MAQQVSRDAKPISCHLAVRASKCPHPPPPVPPLHTVTRHLGLSCKCSAQEWEPVTQSSCPTWCEIQLELCFVPTGHPQKTKQETCLMWLFSTPHPHPPKNVGKQVWSEHIWETCPLLPEAMKLNQENCNSSSCPSPTQLLLNSHPTSLKLSTPSSKSLQRSFTYSRA